MLYSPVFILVADAIFLEALYKARIFLAGLMAFRILASAKDAKKPAGFDPFTGIK